MNMPNILIHGVIGSYKTTICKIFERLGFRVLFEQFQQNPYLQEYLQLLGDEPIFTKLHAEEQIELSHFEGEYPDDIWQCINDYFYSDILDKLALYTQLPFLWGRVQQYEENADVADSSIIGDAAFCRMMVKQGIMKQSTFENVYLPGNKIAVYKLVPPKLFVLLHGDIDWIYNKIQERIAQCPEERSNEKAYTKSYLSGLQDEYFWIYDNLEKEYPTWNIPKVKFDVTGKVFVNTDNKGDITTEGKDYDYILKNIAKWIHLTKDKDIINKFNPDFQIL